MNKKEITIKSLSSTGPEDFIGTASLCLDYISEQTKTHGKWLYIDGENYPDTSDVDEPTLENANLILLTNLIIGA